MNRPKPRPGYTDGKHLVHEATGNAIPPRDPDTPSSLQFHYQNRDVVGDLDEDYFHQLDERTLKTCRGKARRVTTIHTPLIATDCSDLDVLLGNSTLPEGRRIAGYAFLKQYKQRVWLRSVDDRLFADRVALALAFSNFGVNMALCGYGKWPCRNVWECPVCNKHFKADSVVGEFSCCFDRANHHYALTFGFTHVPRRAGVWLVREKADPKADLDAVHERWNPYADQPVGIYPGVG